jgi:hypothetical protein
MLVLLCYVEPGQLSLEILVMLCTIISPDPAHAISGYSVIERLYHHSHAQWPPKVTNSCMIDVLETEIIADLWLWHSIMI